VVSAVLQENRRAGLLYDFSVGEIHYDRNSHPRFIGDGMSNLTGSVAPIDHAAYGHIKGHQKVDDVHIKVNYEPVNQPPFLSARLAASARRRCGTLRCRGAAGNARAEYWSRSGQRRKGRSIWSEALFM
jgi:hypothetical protein